MFSEKSTSFSFKIIFIIFLVIILAFKSAYLLTSHSAENGPSGFRSKHLNFFFELCLYAGYWVEFSIFRKCHLRNFEQINFQEIVEFKYINRSKIKQKFHFKTLICFFWGFWRYFFNSMTWSPNFLFFFNSHETFSSKKSHP